MKGAFARDALLEQPSPEIRSVGASSMATKIIAHLPSTVEVSRRTSKGQIRIDVKRKGAKEGRLVIALGSVEWWPDHNKVNAHRLSWRKFIALLEYEMPTRRSKR